MAYYNQVISLQNPNKETANQISSGCPVLLAHLTSQSDPLSTSTSLYIIISDPCIFSLYSLFQTESNYIRRKPQQYALHFNEQIIRTHFLLLQPSISPVAAQVISLWKRPRKLCTKCHITWKM